MKRIIGVLAKILALFFQGGLLGGKVTRQGRFAQFLLAALIALLVLSRFYTQELECSRLPTELPTTSNWKVASSTIPVNLAWERTLTPNDLLLAASNNEIIFHRSYDSSGCSRGQVIALDASSGDLKWRFPADLIRNVTPIPGGYLLSKCCTSVIFLDTNGSKIWESDTIPSKTFDPKFVLADDKAYFIADSDTYKLSLDDGSLERINQTYYTDEPFWLNQLIFSDNTSNYRTYHAADVLLTARLHDHIFAYQIPTGEALWDANLSFRAEPVFDGNNFITYDSQQVIQIHDIHSGREIGRIALQSNAQPNNSTTGVILAAAAGKIFVRDFQTSELIALNVDLPE